MLVLSLVFVVFFFNDTATTEIYTLSLHDALPICPRVVGPHLRHVGVGVGPLARVVRVVAPGGAIGCGLPVEASLVGALAVAKPADALRAEVEDAARALREHDAADRRRPVEEHAVARIPRVVPRAQRGVLLRVVDQRLIGDASGRGAELAGVERKRGRTERRAADDRDAAVAGQGRAAEQAAPLGRHDRHVPRDETGAQLPDPEEATGPTARELRRGPHPVRYDLAAARVV